MLICKFSGKLVNVETVSTLDSLTRYYVTFEISTSRYFLDAETIGDKTVCILRWRNILLPFYCWNIEKRVASEELTSLPWSTLREYLNLVISPVSSERFSSLYKSARDYYLVWDYLFYENWKGIIFSSEEDETEEELYEIGIAYLSLDKK